MEQSRDERNDPARDWADSAHGPASGLTDHLRRLAQPQLQGALEQPALIQMVRELPPAAPLAELARTLADDALRRAVRLVGGSRSYQHEARTPDGWLRAYQSAVVQLAGTALDALRTLRAGARQVH